MDESANAMLERAIGLAAFLHAGQVDKIGEPYILHPLRVMLAVKEAGGSIEQQAAAALHDVIEDCDVGVEFLAQRFPEAVCKLVDALTRPEDEDYEAYVRRAISVPGASLIKRADVRDNYGRVDLLPDEATKQQLRQKYESALSLLRDAE